MPIKKISSLHYGWFVLGVGVLSTLSAIGLARFGYTPILPKMQAGLGLSNTQTGVLATANNIGYLCLAVIGGFLASHFSPRRVISVSLFVVGGTMILTGFSRGFASALVWRTLTGIGSGGANVPMMGLLAAWFAARRRGLATGVAVMGSSLGLIISGPLVPYVQGHAGEEGWRFSWYILGGIVLGVALIAYFVLRDHPAGMGIRAIGQEDEGGEKQGVESAPKVSPTGPAGWALVYRSGVVWHLSLIYFTFGFSYIIFITYFSKYLESECGFTEAAAGQLLQMVGWLGLACGVLWGWISDLIGRKYGLALVSLSQGIAYLLFAVWASRTGLWISVIFFGLCAWSIPAIMASACGDHLGSKLAPAALGFVTMFMGVGQALGPSVAGRIADQVGSFTPAFLVAMGAAFVGAVASLFLRRAH